MAITLTGTALDLAPSAPGAIGALGIPAAAYTVRVVDRLGTLVTDLPLAEPVQIVTTLNSPDTFTIKFPKHAYGPDDVAIFGTPSSAHEIQVLLGTEVIAWGPAVSPDGAASSSGTIVLNCVAPDWVLLNKRFLDGPRTQYLVDNGFETYPGGWTEHTDSGGLHAVVSTDVVLAGDQALRIGEDNANTPDYVGQHFLFHSSPIGDVLTFRIWYLIEIFDGPALFKAGIALTAGPPDGDGVPLNGLNAARSASWSIDEGTTRNAWQRATLSVAIPRDVTWGVKVWIFAPQGSIVWDVAELVRSDSVSTALLTGSVGGFVDISRLARLIATHAQDNTMEKSPLNIALDTPDCGARISRTYPFSDHVRCGDAFQELLDRDDTFDYGVRYTPTTRTLQLFPGGRGTDRTGTVSLVNGSKPVTGYKATIDGISTVTHDTKLGDSQDAAREEGVAKDTSEIDLTLQSIDTMPTGTPVASLLPSARRTIALYKKPPRIFEVTVDDSTGLLALLKLGDLIGWSVDDGWVQADGTWRIVRRVRDCRKRTMTYTLNEVIG